MRQKKLCLFTLCVWVIVLILIDVNLIANPDIKVQLRLYEGQRKVGEVKPSVTTAYYLKPLFSGNLVLDSNLKTEVQEIKKIFNLKSLEIITTADWGWKFGKTDSQFEVFIINGHEFKIYLTFLETSDTFRLEVLEKGGEKTKKVLKTELVLPQKKSAVYGFEDSKGKPFFLAFERAQDSKIKMMQPPTRLSAKNRPKLLKMVKPVYPKVALRAKVQGKILLEATTDIYGRVVRVKVVTGHPLLTIAAIDAVKQWVYEPAIIKKVPKPVSFIVSVNFSLDPKRKKTGKAGSKMRVALVDKGPKLIKKVEPLYPLEAKKKQIAGFVKLEATTDIYGRVVEAQCLDGNPIFFKSALEAIKQWVYEPYLVKGKPKGVKFTVIVNYKLDGKKSTDK